jgi:hypothetical protein
MKTVARMGVLLESTPGPFSLRPALVSEAWGKQMNYLFKLVRKFRMEQKLFHKPAFEKRKGIGNDFIRFRISTRLRSLKVLQLGMSIGRRRRRRTMEVLC